MKRSACSLLLLLLVSLAPAGRALAAPGDSIVVADDVKGTPGNFFKAIDRISGGNFEQLSAGNAMPAGAAIAFTGPDSLLAVAGQSFATLTLSTHQVVNRSAPGAVEMRGVALAPDGSVMVADFGGSRGETADGRILRLDTTTGEVSAVSTGGLLINPLGIAVGEDGTVYVTNTDGAGHGSVIEVDPSTGAQGVLASNPMVAPWGIAFLSDGELLVADESYNHAFRGALVRIDPATGAQTPLLLERLNGPIENATGVAVDADGEVVVTERASAQVDRVNLQTGVAQQIADRIPSPLDAESEPGVAAATRLLGGPSGTTREATPTFTFEPSIYGAASSCTVDHGVPVPCRRTFTTAPLAGGEHSFSVSSSLFGAQGPAAVRGFTVDPSAPDTLIDSGPSGLTNDPAPSFAFEAPGGGTSFACALDGAAPIACVSPFTISQPLADGPHTFTVRADNDPVGDSRGFTVDTAPPSTSITSGPNEGAATNATQPTFTFGSNEEPAMFKCSLDGVPVLCAAVFSPPTPLAPGQHVLTVAAVDAAGNEDPRPLTRRFSVDVTPPATTITAGPAGTTADATPTFEFTATEAGVTFRCSVDGAAFAICASPFTIAPALADGPHTFRVQATDPAGNVELGAPEREFAVATSVPDTSITGGPNELTNDSEPSFEFSSTKTGSTFTCSVDGGAPAPCQSPFSTATLADGPHTFAVLATDGLGHEDPTRATREFTVDTAAPRTVLGAGPGPLTNDRAPQFEFTSEPGASLGCALDGGPAVPCASPFTAPPLADGAHALRVIATDAAGNVELTPPRFGFTVDTTSPQTSIDAGPSGDTTDRAPMFSFSADEAATFSCAIDSSPPVPCSATFQPPAPLAFGPHTFLVRATDTAGNRAPAVRTFRVIETREPPAEEHPTGERPPAETKLQLRGTLNRRSLRVRITLTPATAGSVDLTVSGHAGRLRLKRHLSLPLQSGIAATKLLLPKPFVRLTLAAHYSGDASHTPSSATVSLRGRR